MPNAAFENLLFIFTDQQRADSLGSYGGDVATPHLDRLAAQGTRYTQAFTPTAICTPTRTALVTGRRPQSTGVTANAGKSWSEAPASVVDGTGYPHQLADHGIEVELIGKSHFGCDPARLGFGGPYFQSSRSTYSHPEYTAYLDDHGLPAFDADALENRIPAPDVGRLDAAVDPRPAAASLPAFFADRTIDRLEAYAASGDRFCLHTHFFGPHRPYRLPEPYADMYDPTDIRLPNATVKETFDDKPEVHREQYRYWQLDRIDTADWRRLIAAYRGVVSLIDAQIGRILATLSDLGLRENTAIIFASDHGAFVTRHKMQDKGPAMYDDIYQVPLILTLPEMAQTSPVDRLVSLLDVSPTILGLLGVPVPSTYAGRDLRPLALADQRPDDWRDEVVFEFDGLQYAYPQRAVRTDRYKLVVNPPDGDELYDLHADPAELTNRITDPAYRDIRDRLYQRLAQRLADADDDFPARTGNTFPGRHPDRRPTF